MNQHYCQTNTRIDHIAIAVKDIESAIILYRDIFGFKLLKRREVEGEFSGMISAEFEVGSFSIVLVQGTSPESQVSRYIEKYGPGVQHVAITVNDVEKFSDTLRKTGIDFCTDVIKGDGLIQIFTKRDDNSGMMFEFIQRMPNVQGFQTNNIQQLFEQLEAQSAY